MRATYLDDGSEVGSLEAEGIFHVTLSTEPDAWRAPIDRVSRERGYVAEDIIELKPETPDLDALLGKFAVEHLHTDDEVRFVLEGEGVFDIRSNADRWMHVEVAAGDLLIVPARRHHRFFLTDKRHIRCVRLYQDKSGWVAIPRAAE